MRTRSGSGLFTDAGAGIGARPGYDRAGAAFPGNPRLAGAASNPETLGATGGSDPGLAPRLPDPDRVDEPRLGQRPCTDSDELRVVFAGGGSGGHLVPGIHAARALQQRHPGAEFLFLRGRRRVESLVLDRAPGPTQYLDGLQAPRGFRGKAVFSARLPEMVGRSIQVLRRFRADVVVGLGGYGAVPVVLAGRAMGLRVVLLEQNVKPGLANRMLGPLAHAVCCAFTSTASQFARGWDTGNPVNPGRSAVARPQASKRFGLDPDRLTLLVVGGSQGARGLNRMVCRNLEVLTPESDRLQVLHVSGESDRSEVTDAYRRVGLPARVESFIPDMDLAYRAADVVVSRAGGTTLAELAVAGLPVVLVPYPHHRDRHQYANARVFEDAGAGYVLAEEDASAASLGRTVGALLADADLRWSMSRAARRLARPRAAECVAAFLAGDGPRCQSLIPGTSGIESGGYDPW